VRFVLGVAYKTIANWLDRERAEENGITSAVLVGVLCTFLVLAAVKVWAPGLIIAWLNLPGFLKLLMPAIPIALVVWVLQGNRRGWSWATEAASEVPSMDAHGALITCGLIGIPLLVWIWVFFVL
jgi:hypothetical protein